MSTQRGRDHPHRSRRIMTLISRRWLPFYSRRLKDFSSILPLNLVLIGRVVIEKWPEAAGCTVAEGAMVVVCRRWMVAIGGWRRQKMMSWNVFLDVFGCVRMCSNVFGDQHIRTHANTSEHIQTHSKHIQTHSNTSKHIQTHSNTSKHIQKYAFSRWSFGLANWFLSKDESFWIEPNGWACFLVRRRSRLYLRRLYEY